MAIIRLLSDIQPRPGAAGRKLGEGAFAQAPGIIIIIIIIIEYIIIIIIIIVVVIIIIIIIIILATLFAFYC